MPHSANQSGNPNLADNRTDPAMKALFRMSRTAGVGLGDYAAVNVLSVIGLIIGFASFLLLIFGDSYFMLVIPLLAIIVCAVAILQIRGSNGTQVGKGFALGGIAFAVLFGGFNLAGRAMIARAEASDREAIAQLVSRLGSAATTQSTVPQAYDLFHKRFKENVSPDSFARTIAYRTGLLANAPIAGVSLGDSVIFETNKDTQVTTAAALLVLSARQKDEDGKPITAEYPTSFRRDTPDGEWTIYSIPDWFEADAKPQQ